MVDYTKEQLLQLQQHSLEMAKYFVQFCNENNLLCYFCGGGCIGALRHNGFVPWDDDLDFFMPRNDYQRLISIWPQKANSKKYVLSLSNKEYIDRNLFVTIRDSDTTVIKPYQQDLDICHGLALDILPLDGYPDSTWQRKKQVIWALLYSLFCAQTIPEKHGGIMALGSKLLLGIFRRQKTRYYIWKYCEKRMAQYSIAQCDFITELCSGPGYMRKRYPKEAFQKAIYVDFEGAKMPIPIGYDEYLKEAFGNYMEMPAVENRVAHHDCVFINLDECYKKYKGKYYCIDNKHER